ncbi:hypothetical protein [Paludibacterium paludis]|uniref:Uncharacterized protein n=1 Tax=Paludibacterium paludis TaxID=1225769 RepID=A0A918U7Z2_9NEIS|nr:hypothetical protein [Paludibacterium paludis]GGY05178.1 hypothetical protein GCM10011289_04690 [Paludibacterium paludis]
MRTRYAFALIALMLAGCSTPPPLPSAREKPAAAPQGKVDLLLREANRLAGLVKTGEIGRVEAADRLNAYRLKIAGSNAIDDASFARYRRITVEREAGRLDQNEAQARMESYLRDTLRKYPRLPGKGAEPAFTDFLLKVYSLPPLGY